MGVNASFFPIIPQEKPHSGCDSPGVDLQKVVGMWHTVSPYIEKKKISPSCIQQLVGT